MRNLENWGVILLVLAAIGGVVGVFAIWAGFEMFDEYRGLAQHREGVRAAIGIWLIAVGNDSRSRCSPFWCAKRLTMPNNGTPGAMFRFMRRCNAALHTALPAMFFAENFAGMCRSVSGFQCS